MKSLTETRLYNFSRCCETPIEDQAAAYELALLSQVLQNGMELLSNAESDQEAGEILRQLIKSAFVIGRRHFSQLV